jgi:hypothetical protein
VRTVPAHYRSEGWRRPDHEGVHKAPIPGIDGVWLISIRLTAQWLPRALNPYAKTCTQYVSRDVGVPAPRSPAPKQTVVPLALPRSISERFHFSDVAVLFR